MPNIIMVRLPRLSGHDYTGCMYPVQGDHHPGSILFFQVGRFYELYDRQAEIAIKVLGLKRMKITRGFQTRCGFPVNGKKKHIGRLLSLGFTVQMVNEGDGWVTRVKKRRVEESWLPMSAES